MALKPFNSIGGFSVGETPSNVILANGDITTTNITTTGVANLNAVGNVKISGGTNGYYLQTDGSGNLVWAAVPTGTGISNGTSNVAIPTANGNVNTTVGGNTTFVVTGVGANVTGTLGVSANLSALGVLTDNLYYANGTVWDLQEAAGSNTQIQYNNGTNNNFGASANFTFNDATNVLTVTGNIAASNANLGNAATANFFFGAGNNLSNIQGANVSGTVSAATTAGTVTTAAQPNITSVGTLTSLDVTGNLSSGNANLGNLATANFFTGTLTTAAQPNITSVGTLTSLDVTGNVAAGNVSGTIGAFTNVSGNGSSLSSITGANVTGQVGNALVAGTVYTNAQPNITSVGTLTSLDVTGNVVAGNVYANSGTIGANLLAGTLTTAAQPNITSVGTLTSLAVTGNVTMANVVASTYNITGVATGISAAGNTQAGGTVLAKAINVVSTVLSGNGVVLPVAVAGMRITVMNTSANSLAVYPASTGIINAQSANVAYTQVAGARLDFVSVSATQWYTLNATYG